MQVINIAVSLLVFATLGVVSLGLLLTASTAGWGTTVPVIAITVTAVLASIAVALSFFRGGHKL